MKTLRERFDDKWVGEPNSGCWLWTGSMQNTRYGGMRAGGRRGGKVCRSHRVAWELYRGPIPSGLGVLHKCDTPLCVNPYHLFLGTQAQNNADRDLKGRQVAKRGEEHGMAKLTDELVRAIRSATGRHRDIAASLGVMKHDVQRVKAGKAWGHVS